MVPGAADGSRPVHRISVGLQVEFATVHPYVQHGAGTAVHQLNNSAPAQQSRQAELTILCSPEVSATLKRRSLRRARPSL